MSPPSSGFVQLSQSLLFLSFPLRLLLFGSPVPDKLLSFTEYPTINFNYITLLSASVAILFFVLLFRALPSLSVSLSSFTPSPPLQRLFSVLNSVNRLHLFLFCTFLLLLFTALPLLLSPNLAGLSFHEHAEHVNATDSSGNIRFGDDEYPFGSDSPVSRRERGRDIMTRSFTKECQS